MTGSSELGIWGGEILEGWESGGVRIFVGAEILQGVEILVGVKIWRSGGVEWSRVSFLYGKRGICPHC